jgi:hypothetical protein
MRTATLADSVTAREANTLFDSDVNAILILDPFEHAKTLKGLSLLHRQDRHVKYPSFPIDYIPKKVYKDSSANELGNCILEAITFCGGFGSKIYAGGLYDEKLKKYRPSSVRSGFPDLVFCFRGMFIGIEIKQKDSQSTEQLQVQQEIEQAYGLYKVVHNYQEFADWFFITVVNRKELKW